MGKFIPQATYDAITRDVLDAINARPGCGQTELVYLLRDGHGVEPWNVNSHIRKMADSKQLIRLRGDNGGRSYYLYPKGFKFAEKVPAGKLTPIKRNRKKTSGQAVLPTLETAGHVESVPTDTFDDIGTPVTDYVEENIPVAPSLPPPMPRLEPTPQQISKAPRLSLPYGDGKEWSGTLVEAKELLRALHDAFSL